MVSTDKLNCNLLADLLAGHGIYDVIASPGSRNAPLLTAFTVREKFRLRMVIDERSAAFIALGMAAESGRPVALVCTSGTALLNYAPAVAEAFYRNVPLIVISADRPAEWIDQDDSQTIRQPGCLASIVKFTYDIPARLPADDDRWMAIREINDALILAVSPRRGPVHINIRIDNPLSGLTDYSPDNVRIIHSTAESPSLDNDVANRLAAEIASTPKVMIVAGFMAPDPELNAALNRLAACPNIIVMTETVSNLSGDRFIPAIDLTLSGMSAEKIDDLSPDIVITLGGALVSRKIKEYLRRCNGMKHWHIGCSPHLIDCFRKLSLAVEAEAKHVLTRFAELLSSEAISPSAYQDEWLDAYSHALKSHHRYLNNIGWSDMTAFKIILDGISQDLQLHYSNGTPIRYSQLYGYRHFARVDCNRGVSGIDGSTSTALGASIASKGNVILITGDMSCQYDLAAISSKLLSDKLKIIVMMNSGGGIFRFIESTSKMPRREFFFSESMNLPIRKIAEAYNIPFFEASDVSSLKKSLDDFLSVKGSSAILAVFTPAEESAEILKNYFSRR